MRKRKKSIDSYSSYLDCETMATPKKIKTLPHSKEAEMMVLGCMLTSINSLNIAAEALHEEAFYFPEHTRIFGCMKTLKCVAFQR